MNVRRRVRKTVIGALVGVGQYSLVLYMAFRSLGDIVRYRKNIVIQMVRIGVESLPVVMLAGAFTGVVTTVQTSYMLATTIYTKSVIGAVVVPTLMLELSALVTGLVMASRVGASIAAELGTMRVTDQIDALEVMGLNAISYLVVPRVVAGFCMFPMLYVASLAVGIGAGAYAGEYLNYLSAGEFIDGAKAYFLPFDPLFGMTKTGVFGFLITSIACWKGYSVKGGAEGVGRSTTEAVVFSCVIILLADYVLADLLL